MGCLLDNMCLGPLSFLRTGITPQDSPPSELNLAVQLVVRLHHLIGEVFAPFVYEGIVQ